MNQMANLCMSCHPAWFQLHLMQSNNKTSRSLERPPPYEQVTKSAFYAHESTMGKWPGRCTSTGQGGSKELDLEWIGPVVTQFGVRKILWALTMPMSRPVMPPRPKMTITLHIYMPRRFQRTWFRVNRPCSYLVRRPQDSRSPYHAHEQARYAPVPTNDHNAAHLHANTVRTSNGSWCMGIKGEMSGTVCVTFTWYMYIYELFIAFVCFVVCSLL